MKFGEFHLKILQIIPYFTPKRGGDVNVCYNLSKQLCRWKHEVTIITSDFEFDANYAKLIEQEGARIMPFHCISNIGLFLISPSMKKWLKSNLKVYDIVHLHDFRSYQNNVVYHYIKKNSVPYVLQAHGSVPIFFEKQQLKKLYDLVWGNKILKDAAKLFALTETEAKDYKLAGTDGSKIEIVPNGIDLPSYENLPRRGEFRKKYEIKNDEKVILYLGRIQKNKGIELLVKAFANLVRLASNVVLVIIGPDEGFLSTLKKQAANLKIANKVIFTGFVQTKIKLEAYVDADIFVTPSFWGFPVTFLEACACGIPIITTNKGDDLNWIQNKVGYVVDYNEAQLCEVVLEVLNDEELGKKFSNNGKNLVKEKFNWEKIAKQVENVYMSCLI